MNKFKMICKKIAFWRPSMKLVALAMLAVLAVTLLPLFRIALYAVPYYDDYVFAGPAKYAMEVAGSPWAAISGAIECVKTEWYAWQGTYASIFFMALMPGLWGEDKYFLGPVFLLVLCTVAILVLVKVLVRDVLRADRASCVTMQAVTATSVIMFIYNSQQGFFWYNAGVHYVGMHSIALLFVAALICLLRAEKKVTMAVFVLLTMLGAFVTAGGNFVTALQGGIVLLSIGAVGIWAYRKKALLLLPSLCIYIVGFYKNVSAPGNSVRARNFEGWGLPPVEAILNSFFQAFRLMGEFTGWIMLAVMVLLVPIIWQMVKKCDFQFRYPGIVLAWSFCLYATGFTPSLYSLGHAGLDRALNAVKITYQLMLILNEVYWLGWLNGYLQKKGKKTSAAAPFWWFYPIMGAIMLVIFVTAPNQAGCYSAYGAYYYVHTGEAYNFYQEYLARVELLNSDVEEVVFEPYHFKPWMLCIEDLSEDPESETNFAVAVWYGKDSVMVDYPDVVQ